MTSFVVVPSRALVVAAAPHQAARKMSHGRTSSSSSCSSSFSRAPAAAAVLRSSGGCSRRRAVGALQLPQRLPAVRRRVGVVDQRMSSQSAQGPGDEEDGVEQTVDVVALGNMCVDILQPPAPIPAPEKLKTEEYLAELTKDAPPESSWEVGGNCNFLIAAARLGLRAECAGHVGEDVYGEFLRDVLSQEGVPLRRLVSASQAAAEAGRGMLETLLCFVLTDGVGGHAFCSRYDLGPWPLLAGVKGADDAAAAALAKCKAVFVNGFLFDEMRASAVVGARARGGHAWGGGLVS